jgi:hypothetical protein
MSSPNTITGCKQLPFSGIPEAEGKHATQCVPGILRHTLHKDAE